MEQTDLLLDANDDLLFAGGDFATGKSWEQEVGLLLRLNQGELKSAPLLGPNLIALINSAASQEALEARVRLHLKMDGKDYADIKNRIKIHRP